MATTPATWNATDGNWFVAANWDEPNPNQPPPLVHHVPGASEDVSIPNNSGASTPFTVTYNGTDTVNTLAGDITGTLDIAGGSLTLVNGGANNSMAIDVGAGATLNVAAGTLNVTAGTYSGTLAGNGTIQFLFGSFNLDAGVGVTVANWVLGVASNGTVSHTNLNTNLTYAGNFTLADTSGNHAVLELDGHTLTLSGSATFDGTVHGPGTVLVTGSSVHGSGGYGAPVIYGGAVLEYATGSTALQHANTSLGDQASLTTGTVKIDAGAAYTIDRSGSLGSSAAAYAIVNNAGTLKVSGASGTSATINAHFSNSGTLTVDSANTLFLGRGALGVVNTLGGSIGGAGTLVLGGTTTLNTSNVTVGALQLNGGNGGAVLTLGHWLTYGGAFSFANQFDTVDLNSHSLALSGASNSLMGNVIDGAGTLKVTGAASIGGNINIGGPNGSGTAATIEDAGTMTQNGNVGLNGTLLIDAGHGYTITTAGNISSLGASGATVTNKGTLTDSAAGTSTISGTFTNTGTLAVASGAILTLASGTETLGKVSGAGTLVFGFGSNATIDSTDVTVAALTLNGGNGGALVTLGNNFTYAGAFSFANQFDAVALNGHTLTLSGSTALAGGTFTGKNGAVDTLTVNGSHADLSHLNFSSWEATDRIVLNGTGGNDALTGSSLADIINGGTGADTMTGGSGNDTYYVDNAGDSVVEADNGGIDQVFSSVSYTLSQFVENLTLTGSTSINANGNAQDNNLVGNSGNNIIDGKAGADVMTGGGGNDTYYVDNTADQVIEYSGGGTDLVYSSVSFSIAGTNVENLTLTGSGNLNGTGNGLGNVLTGNSGNNVLDGKVGADTMSGGKGDDTYYVDNTGDQVIEYSGGGTDLVYSSVSFSIAGANVENMTLTGSASLNATGNGLANTVTGNSGNNLIDGGLGNDALVGGGGHDTFVFDTALTANVDTVADFNATDDTIQLDRSIFTNITALGTLSASAFTTGSAAGDSNDRIIYNAATGDLFYDSDGTGANAAVKFAHLTGAPTISNTNFTVVA